MHTQDFVKMGKTSRCDSSDSSFESTYGPSDKTSHQKSQLRTWPYPRCWYGFKNAATSIYVWAMLLHLIFRGRGPTAAGRFWPRWFVLICDLGWWWTWWRSSGTGRGQLSFRQNLAVVADEPASSNKTARLCFIVSIYNNDVIHARNGSVGECATKLIKHEPLNAFPLKRP